MYKTDCDDAAVGESPGTDDGSGASVLSSPKGEYKLGEAIIISRYTTLVLGASTKSKYFYIVCNILYAAVYMMNEREIQLNHTKHNENNV